MQHSPQHLNLLVVPVDVVNPCHVPRSIIFFLFCWGCTMLAMMSASATYPCHKPCSTLKKAKPSPSSSRTHVDNRSWNWRTTASFRGGTPTRARTVHRTVRSTVTHALMRSVKHIYRGVSFLANPCWCGTTSTMSPVGRRGRKPHYSSGRTTSRSQYERGSRNDRDEVSPAVTTREVPRQFPRSVLYS